MAHHLYVGKDWSTRRLTGGPFLSETSFAFSTPPPQVSVFLACLTTGTSPLPVLWRWSVELAAGRTAPIKVIPGGGVLEPASEKTGSQSQGSLPGFRSHHIYISFSGKWVRGGGRLERPRVCTFFLTESATKYAGRWVSLRGKTSAR